MAKGTPFTLQDLEAKGFRDDGSGIYKFLGKTLGAAVKASNEFEKVMAQLPPVIDPSLPIGLVAIINVLNAAGIPYVREHVFSDKRKFRFDIALLDMKVGIEYEGIFSAKSRHTGLNGYTEDANKYNLAQLEGWKVLRYTAKNYKNFLNDLKQII